MSNTMYDLEQELLALVDTGDLVAEDQREAYERELIAVRLAAVEKRDRVAHFLAECDMREEGIKAEVERLTKLRRSYASARERVEALIVGIITSMGTDEKGKYPVLRGNHCRFSVARNRSAVLITDAAAVPARFRTVIPEESVPSKEAIREALDRKEDVPGATWAPEKFNLRRG